MPSITEAIDVLRAALHKKGVECHVRDAFDSLASYLVLLNSSSPSAQMIRKLCTVLRQPFLPLYNTCLQPALQLSTSVLSTVLGKLCDARNIDDDDLRAALDTTAEVILSGILDFLDQQNANIESDGAVWEVLCRIICEFCFFDPGRELPAFSTQLCLSAYNMLIETAAKQTALRDALRQRAIFGGERLGAAMAGTRDYLLLEALLVLFARLLPPIHNTSQGKSKRFKFVKEVFGSPKLFKCSVELLDIMQRTSGTHWDDVAAQIIDVLARSDITYPQPFAIDEISVCGRVFPQPLATDRLIMDRQTFLANIVVENDDVCESLQVPYSHVRSITLDNLGERDVPNGKVSIMVYLTSPPLVANVGMISPDASNLHARFLLQNEAVGRFMEALRRRGVGKLSFLNPLTKAERKHRSISIGSGFKFTSDSSPASPTASFEGKVQHVNQVYRTDVEDTTTLQTSPMSHTGDTGSLPPPTTKLLFKDENPVLDVPEPAMVGDNPAGGKNTRSTPYISEASRPAHHSSFLGLPGNSTRITYLPGNNDELSDISEFETDNNVAFEQAATQVSSAPKGTKKLPKARVAQNSCETGKSLSNLDSPMFGATSSTQIDVSPKLLLNTDTHPTTVSTEIIDCFSVFSQDFNGPDTDMKMSIYEYRPSDTEPATSSARKPCTKPGSLESELGQPLRRVSLSTGANQQVHTGVRVSKDTSAPPKIIAGSRRKREPVKCLSKPVIEVDDEYAPPRKKSRRDGLRIEEARVKSNKVSPDVVPITKAKRYTKTSKCSPLAIDRALVDLGELAEPKPTRQGTRRSTRIKKRQKVLTGGTRLNATRGKTREVKRTVSQLNTNSDVLSPPPVSPLPRESPIPKIDSQGPLMVASVAENLTPRAILPSEMLEVTFLDSRSMPFCSVKEAASDVIQSNHERLFHIKNEEIGDDQQLVSDVCTAENEIRVSEVINPSAPLEEGAGSVKLPRPIMESKSRAGTITIDLTGDDPPTRENSRSHKAYVDHTPPESGVPTKLRNPTQSGGIVVEEPASGQCPRQIRRSVTFASPIEYVLDENLKSGTRPTGDPSPLLPVHAARSHRSPLPQESSTLSPLRIPTGTANARRRSPDSVTSRIISQNSGLLQASVCDENVDGDGIQDIVEVLNEIQAVIIKGISDKFRNVQRDVQHSRDELIQQVLDELRSMVIENATYFNGLLRLEEDYYTNCKTIIRCWEELIDCNDGIATQFQNALKEYDQNISTNTFPKSLLPIRPFFSRCRVNS